MPESNREEIAKLEALYAGNPEGRVFTHLAEAYRKAGKLDRARGILEQGLMRHPAYASAHVVLGRVLMDLREGAAASKAFTRVLELDPHNMVALRSLGDIAREAGRQDEALRFYEELRSQDPTNEELDAAIAELRTGADSGARQAETTEAAAAATRESAPAPAPEIRTYSERVQQVQSSARAAAPAEAPRVSEPPQPQAPGAAPSSFEEVATPPSETGVQEETSGVSSLSVPEVSTNRPEESLDIETFAQAETVRQEPGEAHLPETALDWFPTEEEQALPGDLAEFAGSSGTPAQEAAAPPAQTQPRYEPQPPEPAATEPTPAPVAGEIDLSFFAPEPKGPEAPEAPLEEIVPVAFEESARPAAGPAQPEVSAQRQQPEPAESFESAQAELSQLEPAEPDFAELQAFSAPAEVEPADFEPAPAAAVDTEPTRELMASEVLTETMADLYRLQGLYERAVEVYRGLVQNRPGDAALRAKLAEVEALSRGETPPVDAGEPAAEAATTEWQAPQAADEWEASLIMPEAEGEELQFEPAQDEVEPQELPLLESAEFEPEIMLGSSATDAADEAEPLDSAWIGDPSAGTNAPTPYAWAEETAPAVEPGPPVIDYFRSLLSWRPSERRESLFATTSPPRPGPEAVTQSQAGTAPSQPAPAAGWAVPESPPPGQGGAVQQAFEEWFAGGETEPQQAPPTLPVNPPAQSISDDDATGDEDDDLEMFRSWLQSLKR